MFEAGGKKKRVITCANNTQAPLLSLFALTITCEASGKAFHWPLFRVALRHRCSTFPSQQEAAARDVSRPVAAAAAAALDEGTITGR